MRNGMWKTMISGLAVVGLWALAAAGCSDDPDATNGDPQDAGHGDVGDVGGDDADTAGADADTEVVERDPEYGIETHFRCHEEPPEGAEPPPELKDYSGGQCPELEVGFNTFESSGVERDFKIVAPQEIEDDEVLPVIFMWHWLAGSAERFVEEGDLQKAVDTVRFLAVVPESGELGDDLQWPFMNTGHHLDHYDTELAFFDDMLTCVHESFNIERNCVASAGISAGGLWTTQLASQRSEYLSSFVSLAGGVQDGVGVGVREWEGAERKLPGIVLWGGPDDWCMIDFEETSQLLEEHLEEDGHFFVECVHNCGHAKPPTEPGEGEAEMAAFWEFVLDHPLWVKEGSSPYTHEGLPESMPEWCGIGKGSAEIRDGDCGPDQC